MKRIVFKIAKSFCACFITLLFFSCSNSESVMEKERKSTVIIDIKQNGLGYELKSKEVPYITRASGRDIKLDAILVKENIDENNYILYHYTTDEVLFATLYISDNTLKDIKLEFDDENLVKTRSLASWYQCANDEYQNYKDFYENNHPIACDIGDLFFGACTVGGVLGSAIYCAF